MSTEKTSLNSEPKKFYFINKRSPKEGDTGDNDNVTIKDKDKGLELVDRMYNKPKTTVIGSSSVNSDSNSWSEGPVGAWIKGIFGRRSDHNYQLMSERKPLPRKVPIKVEPKVFFAKGARTGELIEAQKNTLKSKLKSLYLYRNDILINKFFE